MSFREATPPEFLSSASSSGKSREDQESGSNEMPINEVRKMRVLTNLNHAREV